MHRNEFLRRKKKRIIGTSLLRSSLPSNLFEDMSRGKLLWTQATRVAAAARPQRRDSSTIHHDLHGFRTRVCHRPRDGRRVAPARAGGYGAKGDSPISFFLRQNAFEPEKSSKNDDGSERSQDDSRNSKNAIGKAEKRALSQHFWLPKRDQEFWS